MDMQVTAKFRADIADMQTKLTVLDRQLRGLGDAADGAGRRLGDSLVRGGQAISGVGKNLTLGVTLPLVGIGIAAVNTQKDFDVAMKSLQVNSGASAEDMTRLSELAKQMGADTVFSAGESADAMLELSKGGLSVATIEAGALASTMNLAATEGMGLAHASTIVVNAMNQFGIAGGNSAQIADTLAAGAVASTAGVADLAAGLKYVGTTANQFGYSLGDTTTALAAMNNAGIDSTTAGTSLNRFMLGLIGTTPKARDTMEKLGLSFKGANGELLPLNDVVAILEEKLAGLSSPARARVLNDIFRVEGARAANALLEMGSDNFARLGQEVDKAGVAADLANARMSGVAGALEQLRGSLETAALEIGETLAPYVMRFADTIKTLADRFTSLPAATQAGAVGLGVFAAAAGPALIVMGQLVQAVGHIANAFSLLPGLFAKVGTAFKAMSLAFVANPIGLIIAGVVAAIAGLALAFKAIYDRSAELRAAVSRLVETFKAVASVILGTLISTFQSLFGQQEKAGSSARSLGQIFNQVAQILGRILVPVIDGIGRAFEIAGNILRVQIKVFEILITVVRMVGNVIRAVLVVAVQQAINIFQNLMGYLGPVGDYLTNLARQIGAAFSNIPRLVSAAMANAVGFVESVINRAIDAINVLIRAYNSIPFVDKVAEIAAFRFAQMSAQASSASQSMSGLTRSADRYTQAVESTASSQAGLNSELAGGKDILDETGKKGGSTDKAKEKYDELKKKIQELRDSYFEYRDSVRDSVLGQLSLGQAFDDFTERQMKVKETLTALTEYQSQIEGEATDAQKKRLAELQLAYQEAQTAAAKGAQSIVDEFVAQGERIRDFNENLQKLLRAGLSQQAFDAIRGEGLKRGSEIAAALVQGNIEENARRVSDVYRSVESLATDTGNMAASAFMAQGTKLALTSIEAMIKEFLPAGKKRRELLDAIKSLNDSIQFEPKYIDVVTRFSTQGQPPSTGGAGYYGGGGGGSFVPAVEIATPPVIDPFEYMYNDPYLTELRNNLDAMYGAFPMAKGGIVTGPTFAMIGEAGPEAVIPLSGHNAPVMGETNINVTINAGMGADGAELGRQVVEAIRKYERRSGPVFVSA